MDKSLATDLAVQASVDSAAAAAILQTLAHDSGLRPWQIGSKELVPVVQGGMGVCVSAGGLAGAVARLGGVGTVSELVTQVEKADNPMAYLTGMSGIGKPTAQAIRVELVGRGLIEDIDW